MNPGVVIGVIGMAGLLVASETARAESAPPGRGVTTCSSGQDCSWPVGRPITAPTPTPASPPPQSPQKISAVRKAPAPIQRNEGGNLPTYLLGARHTSEDSNGVIIVPEKVMGALLPGLRAGDVLPAEIEQSIKASPSVPTPIRARVTAGRFRGAVLLGNATLDKELKRILLAFEHMRMPGNDMAYQLRAAGLALSGQVGLEGDYHTQEGLYFAAELGAAAAAGYADATTQRNQTMLGTYQTEPSASNAAKQGAVSALSKTSERFAERARSAPEYTEIEGGRAIQIIIQESPTEVSGS